MAGFWLASLLMCGSPAQEDVVGRYRLVGEPDVASELRLFEDGRFAYVLAAGALDEHSEGEWRREGGSIFLSTRPKPVPPLFSPLDEEPPGEAPRIVVRWPDGRGIAGVDIRVGLPGGAEAEGHTQEDGWSLPDGAPAPEWVELSVPVHGLVSPRFPVPPGRRTLAFRLTANDLGLVDFDDLRLDIGRHRLVMHRDGARLVYEASPRR